MQRVFAHADTKDVADTLERVLGNADHLPDYDQLEEEEANALHEWAGDDEFLLDLIALKEATYDRWDSVPADVDPEGTGDEVIESELFRAAEWLDSASRLYVRGNVERILAEGRVDA